MKLLRGILSLVLSTVMATAPVLAQVNPGTSPLSIPKGGIGTPTPHGSLVGTGGSAAWKVIPDCQDAAGNHLNYTQSSDAYSCGNSGGGGGVLNIAFSINKALTPQTVTAGVYNTVTWSTAAFNVGGGTFASNKWTAPATGYIYMNATIWCSSNCLNTPNTGNPINLIKIIKNGVCGVSGTDVFAGTGGPGLGGGPNEGQAQANGVEFATIGDQYSVCYYADTSGGSPTIDGNPAHTHWSGGYVNSGIPLPTGTLTLASTGITGGTSGRVLFDNAGALGEYAISGSGSVAMTQSPAFTTPDLGTPSALVATNATGTAAGLTAGTFSAGSASNLNAGTLPAARTNGHMNGTATNDNAAAGEVGEFVNAYATNTGGTVTISNASPGIITQAAHGYSTASPVNFTTTGGLPTGLSVGTNYWVCGGATLLAGSYAVATSIDNAIAGTCVNTSSAGSGTHTAVGNVILTSGAVNNITGFSLTAGDWEVTASFPVFPGAGTTTSLVSGNIVTTPGALGSLAATGSGAIRLDGWQGLSSSAAIPPPAFTVGTRFSLSATTKIYSTLFPTFVSGANAGYGFLRARRVR
jgi:hypothetical protein